MADAPERRPASRLCPACRRSYAPEGGTMGCPDCSKRSPGSNRSLVRGALTKPRGPEEPRE